MVFYGSLRESELLSDLTVGKPAADEDRDLPLTAGELAQRFACR